MTWVFAGLGGAWRREPAAVLAAVFLVAALALPLAQTSEGDAQGWFSQPELPLIWLACFLTAARQGFLAQRGPLPGLLRSDRRRLGKEGVRPCRSRWAP